MTGSMADMTRATPQAGVAISTKSSITHIENPIITTNFRKAHDMGRACKIECDFGWDCNFAIFELYGQAGGSAAARTFNEWLVDSCREEAAEEGGKPQLIMADFNITPNKLETVKELIQDELWEDLGSIADWWGGAT